MTELNATQRKILSGAGKVLPLPEIMRRRALFARKGFTLPPLSHQGVGTELKALFGMIGIVATPDCPCEETARLMNERGLDWCKLPENRDWIIGELAKEARRRGLPFTGWLLQRWIGLAIWRFERKLKAVPRSEPEPIKNDLSQVCRHRGERVRDITLGDSCCGGGGVSVHACAIHGECVWHAIYQKALAARGQKVGCCRTCRDYSSIQP